jgi:hypothetical protein
LISLQPISTSLRLAISLLHTRKSLACLCSTSHQKWTLQQTS